MASALTLLDRATARADSDRPARGPARAAAFRRREVDEDRSDMVM